MWWHKAIYAHQVWLDGVYMGHPFYTMGAPILKGEKKARKYYDDTSSQDFKDIQPYIRRKDRTVETCMGRNSEDVLGQS